MFPVMTVAADRHGSSFLDLRCSEQQVIVAGPDFLVIPGSTVAAEMGITVETDGAQVAGAGIMVQPCSTAIAADVGRELFIWEDGQTENISSRGCMVLPTTAAGGHDRIVFDRCCCMKLSGVCMCRRFLIIVRCRKGPMGSVVAF